MPDGHKERDMDLRRLRTFVTVAEQGTVSKAAHVLRIAQPALSRQVASLEDELGFELFERAGRRLLLTARGEQLLGDCRSLLAHAASLDERAAALRRGDIHTLRVAASALTIEGLFPAFLARYAARHPGVKLALIEADADRHLGMLERGEAHLAVNVVNMIEVDEGRFAAHLLPRFQVLAACAPSLVAESGGFIDVRRLARYRLLLLDTTFGTRNIFDAACRLADVRPDVFVESRAAHALLALAEAGHGVAIFPSILRADRRRLRVMRVTLRREPLPLEISLAVLWDIRRTLPRCAVDFPELLTDHIRATFSGAISEQRASARPSRTASARAAVAKRR
jgi:DNA-binding transcriptional LysR family regulator